MDEPPNKDAEHELLRERIARDSSIQLYRQYNEPQAAELIGLHPQTLKSARLEGRVGCVRLGKRTINYFGFQIVDFLIESMEAPKNSGTTKPAQHEKSNLENSRRTVNSRQVQTPSPEASNALRMARQSLDKPRND